MVVIFQMTLLCPEDAYDFYATRKWLSFWNSDSQSQEKHVFHYFSMQLLSLFFETHPVFFSTLFFPTLARNVLRIVRIVQWLNVDL